MKMRSFMKGFINLSNTNYRPHYLPY